ncbi:hypothetical protein K3495_g4624 [Podosphaera aphanis]|nr:hypothetical protein K3495_g4624 [Podosphaera aphanis]
MNISKKNKSIKSAYDSTTFDTDVSIHVDRIVGSASISPSGRDVVLASTDGLDIIDLDSPLNPPRHLRNGLPWLVADVQWSPFAARDYWVVSTANQKALVWNLNKNEDANGCVEHTLSAHKRAITDINFSAHHPDILATCAVDGNVHVWDLRRPKKPVVTFIDWFGGATQIKWNRQDSHIFASSHDRWLRIWDDRKGVTPVRSINAHVSKIYGVDWNRTIGTRVVTCSLDKTIKFWDYRCEIDTPERIIHTDFPVWRARHTPFGYGLLAMPQDSPGDLHLYDQRLSEDANNDDTSMAVHIFHSHGNSKVKEFLWRSRGSITEDGLDQREFQLVSWGEDNELRLQTVEPGILAEIEHKKGSTAIPNLNITRKGAAYKTFRDVEKITTEKKAPTITGPQPTSSGSKVNILSTGMNMMYTTKKLKSYKGCPITRGAAMKAKAFNIEEEDQKKIGWMSGIKFNKPENDIDLQRRFSFLHPDFDDDRGWDGHESLHDEIIRIHKQLPSIEFDNIDMDKRTIIVSTNGPWADDGSSINVTLTIIFPEDYPELKSPLFFVGKNSLMSVSTYLKLKRDVQKIADCSVIRSQGCLEMVLRYLLGEFDLEACIYFKDIVYDADYSLALESSSDEEADCSTNTSTALDQELDPNANGGITPSNHNANVPLPRLCGALFSVNGLLVCFFPPKEDKVKSLLATLTAQNNSRAKERPYFESFARLKNNNLLGQKAKSLSLASEGLTDSDESNFSDTSNASDSDYSIQYSQPIFLRYLGGNVHRSTRRGPPTSDSQISSGACTTVGTTTGRRGPKPKNIIAFYSMADILPSKMVLAREYAIFGDGLSVCKHNAIVAENHGYRDLADVWRYLVLILYNKVHVKSLDQTYLQELKMATARHAPPKNQSNDSSSAFGVSYNINTWFNDFLGRIKWESNPLAVDVIHDLFIHFERQADIQMLAMLSCVLTEPCIRDTSSIIPMVRSRPLQHVNESRYSLELLADGIAHNSVYDKHSNPSSFSTPKLLRTPSTMYDSLGLMGETNTVNPSNLCGDTPSLTSAQISLESNSRHTHGQSTSHETSSKTSRPVNSVGLSSFAAGFSRLTSSSTSPPKAASSRKKTSPVEHILSSLAPSVISWGNTTVIRGSKNSEKANPNPSEGYDQPKRSVCTGIRVEMKNSHIFGGEGYIRTPILHARPATLHQRYRTAYANILFLWGDPVGRLEVLKFNAYSTRAADTELLQAKVFPSFVATPVVIRAPTVSPTASLAPEPLVAAAGMTDGLVITGYCIRHESRLEPLAVSTEGGAVGRCDRCTIVQRQLRCTICLAPVSAIFTPCLSCGCVSHLDCLTEFHAEGYTYCPGGCECNCVVYAGMGIVENWEVMMDSFLLEGKGKSGGQGATAL